MASITMRAENAAAALEALNRFAIDPHWLVYLPPTMSPSETSARAGYLEHPEEAFAYYRRQGVASVVCQEKHMGSRAVAVLCRNQDAARRRFGVSGADAGVIYTRTGRAFFADAGTSSAILDRLRRAADRAGLWDRLSSDWMLLDAEILPWSVKAGSLIDQQYAAVSAAGLRGLPLVVEAVERASQRGVAVGDVVAKMQERLRRARAYTNAWRRYCWEVATLDDIRVAPFHLLASEGAVHMDKSHRWHMETIGELTAAGAPFVTPTAHRFVDLADEASIAAAGEWWSELTEAGGEGIVVKPLDFVVRGSRGVVQPALKSRGREYLRIIYGPDYDSAGNIERLRERGLSAKRSLAIREFALGHEALHRFIAREPLRRVHECVFAIMALESESVDPRL